MKEPQSGPSGSRILLLLSGVTIGVITVVLAAGRFAVDGPGSGVGRVLAATALVFVLSALLSLQERTELIARILIPTAGWLGTACMAWIEGGLFSEATYWFPFAPLVAVLLLGSRAGLAVGALLLVSSALLTLRTASLEPGMETHVLVMRLGGLAGAIGFATALGVAYQWQRLRSERNLRVAHSHLQVMVENLQAGVAITDGKTRIVVVNKRLCDIFGCDKPPEALSRSSMFTMMESCMTSLEEPAAFRERLEELANANDEIIGDEVRLADGRCYERDCVPIVLGDGARGHMWSYYDVTRQRLRESVLAARLETDELTGLASRTHFMDSLSEACAEAPMENNRLAVLYVDLDGFKSVNDRHGHDAGDHLLREVGARLKECLRGNDLPARLGGDEIGIMLGGSPSRAQVEVVAGKILEALSQPCEWNGRPLKVTASVGAASFPKDGKNAAELVRRADAAMYAAKRAGKGRLIHARVLHQTSRQQRR